MGGESSTRLTHQEDQTMQEQGVEEGHSACHLIGEDHTTLE